MAPADIASWLISWNPSAKFAEKYLKLAPANFLVLPFIPAELTLLSNPLKPVPASSNTSNNFLPSLPTPLPFWIILLPIPVTLLFAILANDLLKPPNAFPNTNWLLKKIKGAFAIKVAIDALLAFSSIPAICSDVISLPKFSWDCIARFSLILWL